MRCHTDRDDFSSLLVVFDGIPFPSPPRRAHSELFGGDRPVMTAISLALSMPSTEVNTWLTFGMVRLR